MRLLAWNEARLRDLNAQLSAGKIADVVRSERLFPEIDDLADPDPPPAGA